MFNHNTAASLLQDYLRDDIAYSSWTMKVLTHAQERSNMTRAGCLPIDLELDDIRQKSRLLYSYFIHHPAHMTQLVEEQLKELIMKELNCCINVLIAPSKNPEVTNVADLSPDQVDSLVTVDAVVIRQSPIRPVMSVGAFQCSVKNQSGQLECGYVHLIPVIGKKIDQPKSCPKCHRKDEMRIVAADSQYVDIQSVKLQDIKAITSDWSHNHGIVGFIHDPFLNSFRPGDHVRVTGLFKAAPCRVRPTQTAVKALFKTSLDIMHVEKISDGNNNNLLADTEHTDAQVQKFKTMAKKQTIIDLFAPGIEMLDHVKLGLLCSLVGGNNHDGKSRGSIHVLLCGDPATAKSQLLCATKHHANRSTYVCGRGSTSAGLTATVVRDQESNEFLLEPGAVVIADRGICCIDEFDKIDENARVVLNELMEQQSVSIAKAGIVCTLNARTSIVACANPIASRFDSRRSITENLNMPLALISRFDLVFLLTDPNESAYDRKVARSLLSHFDSSKRIDPGSAPTFVNDLSPYIEYAKTITPALSEGAEVSLKAAYKGLRANSNKGDIIVTTRQLRSLIRLSESLAKLELRDLVTEDDVQAALNLVRATTNSLCNQNNESHNPQMKGRQVILDLLKTAGVAGIPERDLKISASQSCGLPLPQITDILSVLEKSREVIVSISGNNRMYSISD